MFTQQLCLSGKAHNTVQFNSPWSEKNHTSTQNPAFFWKAYLKPEFTMQSPNIKHLVP